MINMASLLSGIPWETVIPMMAMVVLGLAHGIAGAAVIQALLMGLHWLAHVEVSLPKREPEHRLERRRICST